MYIKTNQSSALTVIVFFFFLFSFFFLIHNRFLYKNLKSWTQNKKKKNKRLRIETIQTTVPAF